MSLVIDASIVIAWSLPDENSGLANEALFHIARSGAMAPDLFIWEVANVLTIAVRRNRLEIGEAEGIFNDISDLGIVFEPAAKSKIWVEVFGLSQRHELSIYDAGYLELARRYSVSLATLDNRLANAAISEGVIVFGRND